MLDELKVHFIVGARPNLPKVAALRRAAIAHPGVRPIVVHTGQHTRPALSDALARDLGMPAADVTLPPVDGAGVQRLARIIGHYDQLLERARPDVVVVVGDVDSTLACALAAARRGIAVAHVEAGLRCADLHMPEEQNRRLVDRLADRLYTHSPEATAALRSEGAPASRILEVGNVMIDTLIAQRPHAHPPQGDVPPGVLAEPFGVVTLHRPGLIERPDLLRRMMGSLESIAQRLPLIFPVHPRTAARLEALGCRAGPPLWRTGPLLYREFLWLTDHARLVITDSGGVQEECAFLGRPCLTVRPDTERPVTVRLGTNRVVGRDPAALLTAARTTLDRAADRVDVSIPGWDGRAAERILDDLVRWRGLQAAA